MKNIITNAERLRKWRRDNPEKNRESQKKYAAANREKVLLKMKRGDLRRNYGLSLEEYNEMVKAQDGKCLICGDSGTLNVDHSHKDGKVRGLLCSRCNTSLGLAREDIGVLEKMIAYLKRK
jgi:Autographiviridae endonuclease VII